MPPQKGRRQAVKRKQSSAEDESESELSAPTKKVRWNQANDTNDSQPEIDELQSDDEEEEHNLCLTVTCIGYDLSASGVYPTNGLDFQRQARRCVLRPNQANRIPR